VGSVPLGRDAAICTEEQFRDSARVWPLRRMLEWARNELADAYLIPPFRRYEEVLEILS